MGVVVWWVRECGRVPDAFYKVLVGVHVTGHDVAHDGDDLERVGVVHLLHEVVLEVRELETHESPALLQHAVRFL